jgi:hypothetical protein
MNSEDKAGGQTADDRPAKLREEIEKTREELGETVAAVAEKTDVKAQAQAKVEGAKAQASAKADDLKDNPKALAIAGGVLALLLFWKLVRR